MKEADIYFTSLVKRLVDILDEIDGLIETNGERQRQTDYKVCDLEHLIENLPETATTKQMAELTKELQKVRIERRHNRNEFKIINTYNLQKNKLMTRNSRKIFTEKMEEVLNTLDQPYNLRVMSEEEAKEYISEETKEVPKKNENAPLTEIDNKIYQLYLDGLKQYEIGEKVGLNQSSVCYRLKKIKTAMGIS